MGLLSVGTPLSWEETKRYADHVRYHGITQLINLYNKLKDRTNDSLYFGDEIEYTLVKFDVDNRKARLCLKGQYYLEKLSQQSHLNKDVLWSHEYASYMIEGTPGKPYGALSSHFNTVENNMKKRREQVLALLESPEETIMSITVFPRLGCPPFTDPEVLPKYQSSVSRSLFYPDEAINNSHPRFKTLTRNIRERRGEKVSINVPIYVDANTPVPFTEDLPEGNHSMKADHIYMDAMGFGMGCCCLQVTFQACNIQEARYLYDQLTPLTPILMALSAASPIYRGYLADVDHRWSVISASVDDRTLEERGAVPLKNDKFLINKSRYDSIDSYLSPENKKYNDIPLVYDKEIYNRLHESGMDDMLAAHFAHLFIRDPISLFQEKLICDDSVDTDHFENLQSTNWQTMRFKPPPPNSRIGWRVEFRPMEVQLTDFENAAFVVFLVMLTRVILSYNLNIVIPISKVDENIKRAQKRDAALHESFYFRRDVSTAHTPPEANECCQRYSISVERQDGLIQTPAMEHPPSEGEFNHYPPKCPSDLQELSLDEIINGKMDKFTGLIPFIQDYMDNIEIDVDTRCTVKQYLNFISQRAAGKLMTPARYIREFVKNHPSYKRDSVVSEEINFDLLKRCDHISKGLVSCPELIPETRTKSTANIPKAVLTANTKAGYKHSA